MADIPRMSCTYLENKQTQKIGIGQPLKLLKQVLGDEGQEIVL